MINLGDEVEGVVTGATGLVTGRSEYLFESPKLLIAPRCTNDRGEPVDSYWINESRMQAKSSHGQKARVHEEEAGAAQG